MAGPALATGDRVVLERGDFPDLLAVLRGQGFRVMGPTVRQGDLVLDELASAADLPAGWTDVKEAGRYRLQPRADEARFGYGVGQHSWKPFLFPPKYLLWQARRDRGRLRIIPGARRAWVTRSPRRISHTVRGVHRCFQSEPQGAPLSTRIFPGSP